MRRHRRRHVLSIYLNARGFGFVVFEGHLTPIDWGVREVRGVKKQSRCLESITRLIDEHKPVVLIVRDCSSTGTRRARRIIRLNELVAELAAQRAITLYAYSRADVY